MNPFLKRLWEHVETQNVLGLEWPLKNRDLFAMPKEYYFVHRVAADLDSKIDNVSSSTISLENVKNLWTNGEESSTIKERLQDLLFGTYGPSYSILWET